MSEEQTAKRPETWLVWYLRLVGATAAFAIVPALMPAAWIMRIHEWLGLGAFPDQPVAVYLARSTSLLHAVIGTLAIFLSFDVRRFSAVIACLGVVLLVAGVLMIGVTFSAGMPLWWTASEGLGTMLLGLVMLVLQRCAALSQLEGI